MNFDEVYKRLEYLENEIIYLKAQHRLQDVLACKLTENVEEHDEKLNSLLIRMNKLDLAIELAKNFDENFEENEEEYENGLCSSAFNNKKTGLSLEEAITELRKGKKIKRRNGTYYYDILTLDKQSDMLANDWEIVE